MTVTAVRLVDGAREMRLGGVGSAFRPDLIVQKVSKSYPAVRAVSQDRADDDGTDDHTELHGACVAAVEAVLRRAPATLVEELNTYLRPGARPYLHVYDDEWSGERRLRLRVDQFSPGDITPTSHIQRPVQLQWQAPDGVWEAADPTEVVVPAATPLATGLTFPAVLPWTFPPTSPVGASAHVNPGGEAAHQLTRLYGPCVGPRWTCDTTGESLIFRDTLVLGLGEYVEIDTRARTVLAMSEPDASRLSHLDFAASTWWKVPPGSSTLRYHPQSQAEAGAAAAMSYRPAWI